MNSNKRPTDVEDKPPSKRVKPETPTLSIPSVQQLRQEEKEDGSPTITPTRTYSEIYDDLHTALVENNGSLFSSLLKEFETVTTYGVYYYLTEMVFGALAKKELTCISCVCAFWHHDPEQFNMEIWYLLMEVGSLSDIETIYELNKEAAYKELSLLGANPSFMPQRPDLLSTIELIKKDRTKVEWLKIRGIQVEWT